MRYIIISALAILAMGCGGEKSTADDKPEEQFYMPAEYADHDAVWMGWSDFPPYEDPFLKISRSLSGKVPLKLVAADHSSLLRLKETLITNQLDTADFHFYIIPDNRYWMRDHGATYVIDGKGNKKVVDFGWTLYGNREWLDTYYGGNQDSVNYYYQRALRKTGRVDSIMGGLDGLESIKTDINLEGGSIEVNGKGTLLQTEAVTMQRNPSKSKDYIESELKRVLGVSNVIWLKSGLVEDGFWWDKIYGNYYGMGTNGHTDEFVRFANDSTILLAWVDESEKDLNPINQWNYERMSENLAILEKARDQDGKPFRIIKMPLPDPIHLETVVTQKANNARADFNDWTVGSDWGPHRNEFTVGDSINWVAASSYLNYLVTNDVVLMSTYVDQGSSVEKEKKARDILQKAFPDRTLMLLEVMNINFLGGGIHCSTQQEPSAGK